MIKAIAIDDDPMALKVLEDFCREVSFLQLEKTFEEPKDGLKYLNKFPTDLLFLDIDMPSINGIDLARQLKQDAMVIFTTSRADCAVEGFNLSAVDYLLKPFTLPRFMQAVIRANDFYRFNSQAEKTTESNYIFVRADFNLVKIDVDHIFYIEGLDDYLKIYIDGQKPLVVRMTMKGLLEKLPANKFMRVHRSFIIPTDRIKGVRSRSVMIDAKEIPVSLKYSLQLRMRYSQQE